MGVITAASSLGGARWSWFGFRSGTGVRAISVACDWVLSYVCTEA